MMAIAAVSATAKDIKTLVVTTQPIMHCASCEEKIKSNLRFERGIKKIETNVDKQRVVITYDADKNTPEKIIKAFNKFGYTATEASGDCCKKQEAKCEETGKTCCGGKSCGTEAKK